MQRIRVTIQFNSKINFQIKMIICMNRLPCPYDVVRVGKGARVFALFVIIT